MYMPVGLIVAMTCILQLPTALNVSIRQSLLHVHVLGTRGLCQFINTTHLCYIGMA